jgi:hypothetical protein
MSRRRAKALVVGQGRAISSEHVHQGGGVRAVGIGALGGLLKLPRVAEEGDPAQTLPIDCVNFFCGPITGLRGTEL